MNRVFSRCFDAVPFIIGSLFLGVIIHGMYESARYEGVAGSYFFTCAVLGLALYVTFTVGVRHGMEREIELRTQLEMMSRKENES